MRYREWLFFRSLLNHNHACRSQIPVNGRWMEPRGDSDASPTGLHPGMCASIYCLGFIDFVPDVAKVPRYLLVPESRELRNVRTDIAPR